MPNEASLFTGLQDDCVTSGWPKNNNVGEVSDDRIVHVWWGTRDLGKHHSDSAFHLEELVWTRAPSCSKHELKITISDLRALNSSLKILEPNLAFDGEATQLHIYSD